MFFLFIQNNSGGSFDFDADKGIGLNVAFEANSEDEAVERAQNVIYFDGVDKGLDCPCCGDRWVTYAWHQAETIDELNKHKYKSLLVNDNTMFVHMLDGTIKAVK